MAGLARSGDPVVTFSSLADKLASLGYVCVVEILQDQRLPQRINRPAPASEPAAWGQLTLLLESEPTLIRDGDLVGVSFGGGSGGAGEQSEQPPAEPRDAAFGADREAAQDEPRDAASGADREAAQDEPLSAFYGGLVARRDAGAPVTEADAEAVRALVEHAVGVVVAERLQTQIAAQQTRVAQLERALGANRELCVAIGIVMARRRCNADAALDLLHAACRGGRSILEVAGRVVATGELPPPLGRQQS